MITSIASVFALICLVGGDYSNRIGCIEQSEAVVHRWAPIDKGYYLADRTDRQGVLAVSVDGKAQLLGPAGEVEASYTVPDRARALWYQRKDSLESESIVLARNTVDLTTGNTAHPITNTFGQGRNTVIVSPGCTVLTQESAFSVPKFSRWTAIATRNDGRAITIIETPMSFPILTEYTFNGTEWTRARNAITPEIEQLGFAAPIPRFNDARYISPDIVVFIGYVSVLSPVSEDYANRHLKPLLQGEELLLHDIANSTGYLFAVDLKSRVTRPILAARIRDSLEPGGPFFGRLSVSMDGLYLYVLGEYQVSRIDLSRVRALLDDTLIMRERQEEMPTLLRDGHNGVNGGK